MADPTSRIDELLESTFSRRKVTQSAARAILRFASALPYDYVNMGVTRADLLDRATRQEHCGDALVWSEKSAAVVAGHYCQNSATCPICAHRIQSVRHARYAEAAVKAAEGRFVYHLVFTQRSRPGEALVASLGRLRDALRRFYLMGRRNRDGSRRDGEWGKVAGGLRGIEVKRGEGSGEWHVHAHALVFCSEPLDPATVASVPDAKTGRTVNVNKTSAEWLKATDGESHNVHIQAVDGSQGQSLIEAINETLKYTAWGGGTSDESLAVDLTQSLIACRNRRFFEAFGILRNVPAVERPVIEGPFIIYRASDRGYVPVQVLDVLPTIEESSMRTLINRANGRYRSLRHAAEKVVGVLASTLDKMKEAFHAECSRISAECAKRRSAIIWSAEAQRWERRDLNHFVFCVDVDSLPLPAA